MVAARKRATETVAWRWSEVGCYGSFAVVGEGAANEDVVEKSNKLTVQH